MKKSTGTDATSWLVNVNQPSQQGGKLDVQQPALNSSYVLRILISTEMSKPGLLYRNKNG